MRQLHRNVLAGDKQEEGEIKNTLVQEHFLARGTR